MSLPVDEDKVVDVWNQAHYTKQLVEPIEYMEMLMTPKEFQAYLRGNVIKYISRYDAKGGIEDIKKAQVYLSWLRDSMESEGSVTLG